MTTDFWLKATRWQREQLMTGHWLAMNATGSKVTLKGIPTVEPVFPLPATWVTEVERKNAEISGYTLVDAASVLVTHLSETVRRQGHELLSRQDVQVLLDNLKNTHPTVVNELVPAQLNVGPGATHSAKPAGRRHLDTQPRRDPGKGWRLRRDHEEPG